MVVSLGQCEITPEIIERCRRGEREAFRALYDTYKDKVYSICLYYFHGDAARAEDAAQQAFVKVLTNISQFRGTADFHSWLYRLVANTCADGARRARVQESRVAGSVEPDSLSASDSLEEDVTRTERARSVQRALSSLPPRFRLPLLLRYFEDLSYEQMATALGCSMGTVASRLSRGHKMLAAKLGDLRNTGC
jgi:RNA polymerase sigma-70 factor, ECF subfamily